MCVAYDVLYVTTGMCVQSNTLGMHVSHTTAPSVGLDCVLPHLESRAQTIRRLATKIFARQAIVCSHGVKKQPGKGRKNLENIFPHHLWFGSCVYPTWCEIVSLVESGDLLAPSFAPESINQVWGAVRGALPRYLAQ